MSGSSYEKFFDAHVASYFRSLERAFDTRKISGTSLAVACYEADLRNWFGVEFALPLASGSAAVYMALRALGIGPGDRVAVSALAPIPTILPILHIGAKPVFVDVAPGSFFFDIKDLKKVLRQRPKAVLAVALWGYPVLTWEFLSLIAEQGLSLIEDSAHAHGTVELGRLSGTIGDIGCFSTHENKLLSTGEGGFVLTHERSFHEAMHSFAHLGYCGGEYIGFNFKLSAPQAVLGSDRLCRLKDQLSARRAVAQQIKDSLNIPDFIREVPVAQSSSANFYNLGLIIDAPERRVQDFRVFCHQSNVPTNAVKYNLKPTYRYPLFTDFSRACPAAEKLAGQVTSLPCLPDFSEEDIDHVTSVFNRGLKMFLS
ncbi:DegT/DnrJ/EryC1/StrS family aminotransferase [Pseudomonas japonica]|uniref:DegT/DnrJ/EryC1/StrS family aminotransferase n=1 Tax=Pseudomonas japonica TaxID=256466 RepID=UPI0015E45C0F|nr:DegT/DnrJ/EryC1/StrS family aminotransferase [Pseudomonas japonica]MBA1244867.1 hypothetical protein [Pseudomonas japonica]